MKSWQHHRQGNLLERDDEVHAMADNGFLICNELAVIGATLTIPVSWKKEKCSFQKKQISLVWSAHIDSITTKAAKRLYLLRQLKRAGIAHGDLVRFYCSVIRSILECACKVFHCNLPLYLSDEIERIQRRALRIIFPDCSYSEGLAKAGLTTLYDWRSALCKNFSVTLIRKGTINSVTFYQRVLSRIIIWDRLALLSRLSARQTGSEIALSLAIVCNIF